MFTTYILAANWYEELLKLLPDGKLFSLRAVFDAIPAILKTLPVTLLLTLGGAFFGIILAMIFAVVKINRTRILYPIQALFVSFLRGTPLLVQLMLTYFGIPLLLKAINQKYGTAFNINAIPASVFAIIAFAFNEAAYASETIRAAILSVDPGEIEAARSLGMTNRQVYLRVIIPNAAAKAQAIGGADYRYFERFISVSIIYWIVNIVIEQIGRAIEKAMDIKVPANLEKTEQAQGGRI